MTGLLQKDLYILAQRRNSILMFILICIVMAFSMDGSFIVGYATMLSLILSISTIAYDEADNGLLFLMTLPVDTRAYARSKYVFAFLLSVISWAMAVVLMLVFNRFRGIPVDFASDLFDSLAILLVMLVPLNLMIPLQLKYGAEKSRLVLALVAGIIVAVSVAAKSVGTLGSGMESGVSTVFFFVNNASPTVLLIAAVIFDLIITVVSVKISEKVVADKTF